MNLKNLIPMDWRYRVMELGGRGLCPGYPDRRLVLPGVNIGDFCIVGAGSVVTRDIPAGSIAAGNPARVLRPMSEAEKASLIDTFEHDRLFGWSPRRDGLG